MGQNPMYEEFENLIEKRDFESAGILLGQILNEQFTEDELQDGEIESFYDGLHGETIG